MDAHLAGHALDDVRGERDDLEGERPVARDVAVDVAGLLELQRAWVAPPQLAATPPLRAPALDAGDGVALLHAAVELVRRPTHGAQAGQRDPKDAAPNGHTLILGPAPAAGLGILGGA